MFRETLPDLAEGLVIVKFVEVPERILRCGGQFGHANVIEKATTLYIPIY